MTATVTHHVVADRLRPWATGSLPLAAAVELLIRAFDGRFARHEQPWIRIEANGYAWLDDHALAAGLGRLSGGERRVLSIVAALADTSGNRRIDLADAITEIDRTHLDLVLAALAHAAGSHLDSTLVLADNGDSVRLVHLSTLHPWPATAPSTARSAVCSSAAGPMAGPPHSPAPGR